MKTQSSPSQLPRPWEYSAFEVTVKNKQRLSPNFLRITLTGEALHDFAAWGLDQRIKIVLPMPDGSAPDFGLLEKPTPHPKQWYARWKTLPENQRNVLRTYTPSGTRPEIGEIDVDFFLHYPAGPASRWAETCYLGDELIITGPDTRAGYTGYGIHYTPPATPDQLLLVGDETALPAIANIIAATPSETLVEVFLEVADPGDDILGELGPNVRTRVLPQGERIGENLEQGIVDWGSRLNATCARATGIYAWVAGEATVTTRIRRHLTTVVSIPKEHVAFLGYWKLGGPLI